MSRRPSRRCPRASGVAPRSRRRAGSGGSSPRCMVETWRSCRRNFAKSPPPLHTCRKACLVTADNDREEWYAMTCPWRHKHNPFHRKVRLFVHRDSEGDLQHVRTEEIHQALAAAAQRVQVPPTVCVVPVRMQAAWLLFDEQAIRWAAGNPHGRASLILPPLNTLAQLPDAKRVLYDLLREASGLTGRRRRQFQALTLARAVAEVINDFSPLRTLGAFRRLEDEIRRVAHTHGWHR